MLQGGTGADGEQVAYEIVDETGEAVSAGGDQIAVRVIDEAGHATIQAAGEQGGVSFQVVDGTQVCSG